MLFLNNKNVAVDVRFKESTSTLLLRSLRTLKYAIPHVRKWSRSSHSALLNQGGLEPLLKTRIDGPQHVILSTEKITLV